MHQYGLEGFCLVWAVNNALQRRVVNPLELVKYLAREDDKDKKRGWDDFIARDGVDFEEFRNFIKEKYGIKLVKVDRISIHGKYLVTYDFGDYYHTVAVRNGKVLDSRKKHEIKTLNTRRKLVDIYSLNL
jgi:hypothetical protein